jgi:iron complex outermembrane receptor protein
MNFKRKELATALAYALGAYGAGVMVAGDALAQDIRVEVTGSNIRRVEAEGALPVQVLSKDDIDKTGATTAQDLLQLISANQSAGVLTSNQATGASTFSAQTASLRGLGGQRTLVLINGQRWTNFPGTTQGVSGVDLNAIPYSAIERVEILLDGASAVYGSDAVGGVINFILRKDFRGIEATGYYGAPTRSGDGAMWQGKITGGWGDLNKDKYNVFASYYYTDQEQVWNKDRDFAATGYRPDIGLFSVSSNTFPATVSTGRIGNKPPCQAPYSTLYDPPILGSNCYFDPNLVAQAQPALTQQGLYASGRYQFNPDWQGFLNYSWTKAENKIHIQPTPISDIFPTDPGTTPYELGLDGSITIKPTSPYYPTQAAIDAGVNGQPLNVRYRCVLCGDREQTDTTEQWGFVGGVQGYWKNWSVDVTGFYSEGTTTEKTTNGYVFQSLALPILNSDAFNPFGANPQSTIDAIAATKYVGETYKATSKLYGGDAKISGDIWKLPAGPMALAVGASAWRESFDQQSNPVLGGGDLTGYGGAILGVTQSRNIWAVYGELNVPIVKGLEGTAAVRYDDYSDFGGTTNPKFSLRWQPMKEVLLRGSYGTGFIAPNLYQLYVPNTLGVSQPGLSDPLRCPTTGDPKDCFTQFGVKFGGNSQLQPETSFQVDAGIVLEPTPGFSISVDWFKINLANQLGNGVSPGVVLGDLDQYGYLVTRGPVDPAFPTLPGPITQISQTYINLGAVHIVGIDATLKFQLPKTAAGQFGIAVNGTYFNKYDVQQSDGTWAGFVSNQFGAATPGVTPRWKSYSVLSWGYGPWTASLANTYQSGYIDNFDINGELDPQYARRVGSMSLWDIQGSYTGFKNWKFTLGAKNMFDTNPPLTNQITTFQGGYDPSYYDARARFVYGEVTFSFK